MQALTLRTDFGVRKVFTEENAVCATFSNDRGGEVAFGVFINGLTSHGGFSLLDTNADRYLVGTVDQLAHNPPSDED